MGDKIYSSCPQCIELRQENARLKSLLAEHNIPWGEKKPVPEPTPSIEEPARKYSPDNKIAIFRQLFRGRTDIYPVRWESNKGGAGYSPACKNEWRPGVCGKPRIKRSACKQRQFLPVTDRVIYNHLAGVHTVGIYPLLKNDTCYFLATDFDKTSWREDALAYLHSCKELNVPAALEISRSGQGAHVWIFFSEAAPAVDARRLGAAIISYTCSRTRQLSLDSYDRFFPNQDTLPKGGFGNLIALPLQKLPREKGFSVFVDDNLKPYEDQWSLLATLNRLSTNELQ